MSARTRGLLLALLQVLLVASLGAKLLYDRATRPRVWVRAAPIDPDLPFRGRYVQIRLEVDGSDLLPGEGRGDVTLSVEGERLVAHPSEEDTGVRVDTHWRGRGTVVDEPVAFFIPEHATDPSRPRNGEELWVEITVPRRGPPRPIRLGLKKGDVLSPLEF